MRKPPSDQPGWKALRKHGQRIVVLGLMAGVIGLTFGHGLPAQAANEQLLPRMDIRKVEPGARVNVEATQFTFHSDTKVGEATGEVILTYGPYIMVANHVTYDQDDDVLHADGEVRLREPNGNILEAELMDVQNKFRDGFAEKLRLLLTNDATVTADYSRRKDGSVTVFTHAQYTRCKTCVSSNGTPLWQIKAQESTHVVDDHRIYHKNARFELLGFPVFYTPYFSNPDGTKNNQTGFLAPTLSHSQNYGWGYTVPYIISLDPSYDITLMPMFTSQSGPMPRAQWRQKLQSGAYSIDVAGLSEGSNRSDKRGYARAEGQFALNQRWNWGFDLTAETDDTFARAYKVDSRTIVTDQLFVTGLNRDNYVSARAMMFRNLVLDNDNTQGHALPYLQQEYTLPQKILGGDVRFASSFYRVVRKDFVNNLATPTSIFQSTGQSRATNTASWDKTTYSRGGLVLNTYAQLRSDLYQIDETPDGEKDKIFGRLLPSGSVDLRYPWVAAFGQSQHVIAPVAQIVAATDETRRSDIGNEDSHSLSFDSNSLFLHDRFTGLDRYEGGTRANLGLQYSILGNSGKTLRASIGQSYHLAGKNSFDNGSGLENKKSDIVAAVTAQPWSAVAIAYQLRMDPSNYSLLSQEAWLKARFSRLSLSGGYADLAAEPAYGRDNLERQAWISSSLTIYGPWSLFGGAHYDFKNESMIKDFIGVGFDCDCMNIKFYYTENYDSTIDAKKDRSLLFNIELKTLGATDTISPF